MVANKTFIHTYLPYALTNACVLSSFRPTESLAISAELFMVPKLCVISLLIL